MMQSEDSAPRSTACKTCTRRRIKCDFERPACRKCQSKGLICPGYGRRLKWVGGVAARGYLKGRPLPTRDQGDAPWMNQAMSHQRMSTVSLHDRYLGSPSLLDSQLSMTQLSTLLLDYYDRKIAGTMVWLDSEENQYRRRAIPLARCRPGLLWAIIALSAHHGSSSLDNGADLSEKAHNESLGAIQQVTQHLTHRLGSSSELNDNEDVENAEWLLASSMVMSNYHINRSSIEASDCHRRAARLFSNVFKSTRAKDSGFFQFLQSQLAICDVLAATTLFNDADILDTIRPSSTGKKEPFAEYLQLLHQVTLDSRQHDLTPQTRFPTTLRTSFEQARDATLEAADRLHLTTGPVSRDFTRLVNVYHDVALLYAYRVLGHKDSGGITADEHELLTTGLFGRLNGFEDKTTWAHNMPWPAFIAGVESHGNRARQSLVEDLFTTIFQCTGFKHYLEVVEFLREFWQENRSDWQPLARQWALHGRRIILY